ncbi:MAG: sugar ABC transporter permease [Clostridiales bacterium]|nr:sugar ABC transporter permease [Clostridiales bacterium]
MRKSTSISRRDNNRNGYFFLAPYFLLFFIFILVPVVIAIALSFSNFNAIETPSFVGFLNYINLITKDEIFMQKVLPNTIVYAIIVGPCGYILSFVLAWALSQLPKMLRTIFALIIYSPTMTGGVAMAVLWKIMFSGDQTGYINSWLMSIGIINEPIIWLVNTNYLLPIVIIIALWNSIGGIGFLAILAGILNSDETLYEAAAIDGVKNRFQEMIYITIPNMKPQMLFAAVMSIVGAFQGGLISTQLTTNPTPGYAAQLMVNHIEDYGFIRYEMGYASAVSVVLLSIIYIFSKTSKKLFSEN